MIVARVLYYRSLWLFAALLLVEDVNHVTERHNTASNWEIWINLFKRQLFSEQIAYIVNRLFVAFFQSYPVRTNAHRNHALPNVYTRWANYTPLYDQKHIHGASIRKYPSAAWEICSGLLFWCTLYICIGNLSTHSIQLKIRFNTLFWLPGQRSYTDLPHSADL